MFQRLTSILFGDNVEDGSRCPADPAFDEKEDDEEWILVDYLAAAADARSGPRLDRAAGARPQDVPSPDCPARYSSCSSLDSAAGDEPGDEAEDEQDEDEDEAGFLRLEACALEESWFITPPPCFTAGGRAPVLLETSPLENLLIEHPSMSVYAVHAPSPRHRALRDSACRSLDQPLLRVEAPRRPSGHAPCYAAATAAALSARTGFPEQAKPQGRPAQRARDGGGERQHLSRNALRRLNLLRQAKSGGGSGVLVHQPGQRQFNY